MDDPRKGHPSASGMERLSLCPGSLNLEKRLGLAEIPSELAASGTAVHDYIRRCFKLRCKPPSPHEFSPQELEIAHRAVDQAAEVLLLARAKTGLPLSKADTLEISEVRMWGNTFGENKYSGQADLFVGCARDGWGLVVDYKTGWSDVEPAATNLQLRTLAVLAAQRFGLETVIVAIVQPSQGEPTIAVYDRSAILAARYEIETIVDQANDPDAPRYPSKKACRWCPAKALCPNAMELLTKLATGELAGDWPTVLEQVEVAELVIADLKERAKQLLQNNPKAIPGWELTPGATRTTVTDPKAAFGKINDIVPSDDFMGCCTVKIGELTKVFATKAGIKNKKTARSQLESRIADFVEHKANAPSLARTGEEEKEEVAA